MPYPATQTYWLELADAPEVAWGLRRYSHGADGFTCEAGYHDALVYLGRRPAEFYTDPLDDSRMRRSASEHAVPHDDPRWPTTCKRGCGYVFTEDDEWQDWDELIYRRPDTGAEYVLHQNAPADEIGVPSAPPGACWDAWWMPSAMRADRRSRSDEPIYLMVRCPNGSDWAVDSEASNCTRKGEPHSCWVRHGDPRDCRVTVDKNGDTCAAGAGSIQADDYHGFLQDGMLTAG